MLTQLETLSPDHKLSIRLAGRYPGGADRPAVVRLPRRRCRSATERARRPAAARRAKPETCSPSRRPWPRARPRWKARRRRRSTFRCRSASPCPVTPAPGSGAPGRAKPATCWTCMLRAHRRSRAARRAIWRSQRGAPVPARRRGRGRRPVEAGAAALRGRPGHRRARPRDLLQSRQRAVRTRSEARGAERYREAVSLDNEYVESLNNLGNALAETGWLNDAVHALPARAAAGTLVR